LDAARLQRFTSPEVNFATNREAAIKASYIRALVKCPK
jgi:hypothetical protein